MLLESGFHTVFHADADCLILDFSSKLEEILFNDFVCSADVGGITNTGVWMIRNSPWSIEFLSKIYTVYPSPEPERFWEQTSMTWVLSGEPDSCRRNLFYGEATFIRFRMITQWADCQYSSEVVAKEHRPHVTILPGRRLNAFPHDYETGDFIIHFAGTSDEIRWHVMDALDAQITSSRGLTWSPSKIVFEAGWRHILKRNPGHLIRLPAAIYHLHFWLLFHNMNRKKPGNWWKVLLQRGSYVSSKPRCW